MAATAERRANARSTGPIGGAGMLARGGLGARAAARTRHATSPVRKVTDNSCYCFDVGKPLPSNNAFIDEVLDLCHWFESFKMAPHSLVIVSD